jgi:DUF4097 and DUF4098 domain-containing protein YvlB
MTAFRPVHAIVILAAASSIACSIDVQSSQRSVREEKRFTLTGSGPVEVDLRTFDGTIQVRSWDRNEVLVEIERRGPTQSDAEGLVVETSQEGGRIRVDAREPRTERSGFTFGPGTTVNLTVSVPRKLSLEARTGDGSIEVDGVAGAIGLDSGDGQVTALRVEGQLTLRTGDGSIRVDDSTGQIDASTGDGQVDIAGRLDALNVRTGDGRVSVDVSDGSQMKSAWNVTTGDGSISMSVPQGFGAEVDAYSGDGPVRVDGVSTPGDRDESEQRTVRGRLGSGGQTLRLRSGDGAIEVTRR